MKLHCHYLNKDKLYTLGFIILHYIILHYWLQYTLHYMSLNCLTASRWITLHSSALHDLIYISVQNSKNWNWIGRPSTTPHEFVFAWSIANTMFHIQEFIPQCRVLGLRKEVWSQKYLSKLGPRELLGCLVQENWCQIQCLTRAGKGSGEKLPSWAHLEPSCTKRVSLGGGSGAMSHQRQQPRFFSGLEGHEKDKQKRRNRCKMQNMMLIVMLKCSFIYVNIFAHLQCDCFEATPGSWTKDLRNSVCMGICDAETLP